MAGESLNPGGEFASEHVRKGEACLLAAWGAGQQSQTAEGSATPGDRGAQGCVASPWAGVWVLVLALTPGSATCWLGGPGKSFPAQFWFYSFPVLQYVSLDCNFSLCCRTVVLALPFSFAVLTLALGFPVNTCWPYWDPSILSVSYSQAALVASFLFMNRCWYYPGVVNVSGFSPIAVFWGYFFT